jgi:asparagine synthase (glutamine-hydrolysing)
MCGILGLIRRPDFPLPSGTVEAMTRLVSHRGPDGAGYAYLESHGDGLRQLPQGGGAEGGPWRIALGHRRLKILDLSEAADQPMAWPMASSTGSLDTEPPHLWLIYNGEVYNYLELRRELQEEGWRFATTGDTEVVLAAYEHWGTECFRRFHGMWGLVLIDGRRRRAVVSRDRLGIKPLYLRSLDGCVAVVSELKQLTAMPGPPLAVHAEALGEYLSTGYEETDRCFFAGVEPLAAGTWRSIDLDTLELGPARSFWDPALDEPEIDDPQEAAALFAEAFRHSVTLHLRSDVPVGCALSGGLDSSAVAGVIQDLWRDHKPRATELVQARQPGQPPVGKLQTFTATFPGSAVDEGPQVRRTAAALGADAFFVEPRAEELLSELDDWVWSHDEPVGSLSQYAGYRVARLTREHGVPVVLNGQGGDEVLGGYWQSYLLWLRDLARRGRAFALAGHLLGAAGPGGNPRLLAQLPVLGKRYLHRRRSSEGRTSPTLQRMLSMGERPRRLFEIRHLYLPRLLKWDDRNFMASSVEGRYPFLDHRLIELCLRFSPKALYRSGWTKRPLRQGLEPWLPEEVRRRKVKLGFETPQERWLRGPLAPVVRSFADGDSPLWAYLEPAPVRAQALRASEGLGREQGEQLLRALLADRWMRRFGLAGLARKKAS